MPRAEQLPTGHGAGTPEDASGHMLPIVDGFPASARVAMSIEQPN